MYLFPCTTTKQTLSAGAKSILDLPWCGQVHHMVLRSGKLEQTVWIEVLFNKLGIWGVSRVKVLCNQLHYTRQQMCQEYALIVGSGDIYRETVVVSNHPFHCAHLVVRSSLQSLQKVLVKHAAHHHLQIPLHRLLSTEILRAQATRVKFTLLHTTTHHTKAICPV